MLLGHVWEHIALNRNFGLASENEQAVERGHRERREEREKCARKTDMWSNLVDTMKSGISSGDPGVRSLDRRPVCSRCGTNGDHWTMGCPQKTAVRLEPGCDDDTVLSFFCDPEEQPEDQISLLDKLFLKSVKTS